MAQSRATGPLRKEPAEVDFSAYAAAATTWISGRKVDGWMQGLSFKLLLVIVIIDAVLRLSSLASTWVLRSPTTIILFEMSIISDKSLRIKKNVKGPGGR